MPYTVTREGIASAVIGTWHAAASGDFRVLYLTVVSEDTVTTARRSYFTRSTGGVTPTNYTPEVTSTRSPAYNGTVRTAWGTNPADSGSPLLVFGGIPSSVRTLWRPPRPWAAPYLVNSEQFKMESTIVITESWMLIGDYRGGTEQMADIRRRPRRAGLWGYANNYTEVQGQSNRARRELIQWVAYTNRARRVEYQNLLGLLTSGPGTTPVSQTSAFPIEAAQGIAQTGSLPVTSSAGVSTTALDPVDTSQGVATSSSDPVEANQGVAASTSDPVQSAQGVAGAGIFPVDEAQSVAGASGFPVEALQAVVASGLLPLDETQGVASTIAEVIEALGGVAISPSMPIDEAGNIPVSSTGVFPLDVAANVSAVAILPVDEAKNVAASASAPVDETQTVTVAILFPIMASKSVSTTSPFVLEALQALRSLAAFPVESGVAAGGVVVAPGVVVVTDGSGTGGLVIFDVPASSVVTDPATGSVRLSDGL